MGAAVFFLMLIIGLYVETIILSFAIITKNQYEELILKNKNDDDELKVDYSSSYSKLQQLNDLRKNQIITEDEYNLKKEEILKNL